MLPKENLIFFFLSKDDFDAHYNQIKYINGYYFIGYREAWIWKQSERLLVWATTVTSRGNI